MFGLLTIFASLIFSTCVFSGVALEEGTRVVFDASAASQSIHVTNTNRYSVVVQSWVDDGDLSNVPQTAEAPLITKPALFKLAPGASQVIQLINIDNQPVETERLYWLNIHELPPSLTGSETQVDKLALTMQTQYKIFYRQPDMTLSQQAIQNSVQVDKQKKTGIDYLAIKNAAAIHLNLAKIELDGQVYTRFNRTIAPGQTQTVRLESPLSDNMVMLTVIDDKGALFDVFQLIGE
ncbi:fimbrial biogenesis chaperone [Salinivibrio sp. IB282]|uniref:fimbrial biogenesis chaperone n=1 Tax=Salinivibrio sp. IB282 TaxID=1766122 RepID=UPI00098858A7|nr:molecular chaperone [Salinivibrio sp. IB282]OOE60101.1 hypothetical protein BZG14_13550 [Salinivibrio sp. IB282]